MNKINEGVSTLLAVLLHLFGCFGAQAALRLSWGTKSIQGSRL
jgi:hypothetical protein